MDIFGMKLIDGVIMAHPAQQRFGGGIAAGARHALPDIPALRLAFAQGSDEIGTERRCVADDPAIRQMVGAILKRAADGPHGGVVRHHRRDVSMVQNRQAGSCGFDHCFGNALC